MTTIPASAIVNIQPNVLAAGGNALDLVGLLVTTDDRVPIGSVMSFASPDAITAYFGSTSQMSDLGEKYFNGYEGSPNKPGNCLVAQYPLGAVGAWLRGADVSTMTLAELQALSGTLGVVIDGVLQQASINLAAATSFSNAASIIGSSLAIQGPLVASVTASIAGGTMTVSAVASGTLGIGDVVSGTGITVGTFITAQLSGTTGGVGTYSVSPTQTRGSGAASIYAQPVSYDSVSGGFLFISPTVGASSSIAYGSGALATSLSLTQALGATISQGAAAATPAGFMDDVVIQTQNWVTFMLTFDPDEGVGNTEKLAFSEWTNDQNKRYAFVCWDTDTTPITTVPATTSMGAEISDNDYGGTFLIGAVDDTTGPQKAAFVCGIGASFDTEQTNGRTTYAFRRQTGLEADVTNLQDASNLAANGYNYYGVWGTADDEFIFLYPGKVSGDFVWMDSYINQIWLNNAFQLSLMSYLTETNSIPFNSAGYTQVEAAMADPINAAMNFGAIRSGITLSSAQAAAVNAAAGRAVAPTIETRGWYLQVVPASAAVRQARGPLQVKFWYTDGQSVQQINVESVAIT